MNRTSRCAVLSTISAALVLVGCGSDAAPDASSGSSAPTVLATTSIWADITANVACDGLAEIETIIPLGGDPHAFEPSLRDRETMENAALIVANGLLLEESLADTIGAVEGDGVPVLRVGDGLDTLPIDDHGDDDHDHHEGSGHDESDHDESDHDESEHDESEHDESEHDESAHDDGDHADAEHEETEHEHGDADPHIWFDPTLVADAVPGIVDALVEVGIDRAALETCADAYLTELATLDTDVAAIVAPLATDARLLVTNHDSLGYFAHRYGFEVLGSILPSSSSLAEANPADLDDLAARIEATGVPAILAETQHSSSDADALADRLDVDVVTLMTATLDEPGSPAGTYTGWLRATATSIVDALAAGEPG